MERRIANLALPLVSRLRAERAERAEHYQREAATARAQGYRPRYCLHGTYQWHDWDVICPGCEGDEPSIYVEALAAAHVADAECTRRADTYAEVRRVIKDHGTPMPAEAAEALITWVFEPIDALLANR